MFAFGSIRLPALVKREKREAKLGSRAGFCIGESDSSNIVEELGTTPRKAVIKAGNGYLYALCASLSKNDVKCMEIAKEHILSTLSSNQSARPSIPDAISTARSVLANMAAPDMVEILSYLAAHDTAGYGPISIIMENRQCIEEIEVNSPDSYLTVYMTKYGRCATNLKFSGEQAFRSAMNRLIADTEKELGESSPIVDVQVADMRIHAQMRPYAISGAAASIRIGGRKEINLAYLLKGTTATPDILAYLWMALGTKQNLIVSGAPASGKTTLLNSLMSFIPPNEKVVTIEEDINEIRSSGANNIIALYGSRYNSVGPKEQVINSLRLRPSRIIVGEMRGEEARDLFMGANIGISFSATMHSNEGGMSILKKLLVKPMSVDTKSLSMLDIAIYMKQHDINTRKIFDIVEYRWLSRAEILDGEDICGEDRVEISSMMQNSVFDRASLSSSKVIVAHALKYGMPVSEAVKEFERRSKLIEARHRSKKGENIEEAVTDYTGW